jgi:GNAT superfamily N-acetyltransferase
MTLVYAWRYFRRRGAMATIRTVMSRFVCDSYEGVVYRTRLAGPPAPDHFGDIVFRVATPSDLDHLAEFEQYGRGKYEHAYRNDRNNCLFVACHGDRIVAIRRYSRDLTPGGVTSRVLDLGLGQVCSADAFCLPEYRNQGVNRHFALFTMRFLASQGYTEELGVIDATNVPSLHSVLARGSEFVRFFSYSRILFYERLRISKEVAEQMMEKLRR